MVLNIISKRTRVVCSVDTIDEATRRTKNIDGIISATLTIYDKELRWDIKQKEFKK